jgi:hypothetical protein
MRRALKPLRRAMRRSSAGPAFRPVPLRWLRHRAPESTAPPLQPLKVDKRSVHRELRLHHQTTIVSAREIHMRWITLVPTQTPVRGGRLSQPHCVCILSRPVSPKDVGSHAVARPSRQVAEQVLRRDRKLSGRTYIGRAVQMLTTRVTQSAAPGARNPETLGFAASRRRHAREWGTHAYEDPAPSAARSWRPVRATARVEHPVADVISPPLVWRRDAASPANDAFESRIETVPTRSPTVFGETAASLAAAPPFAPPARPTQVREQTVDSRLIDRVAEDVLRRMDKRIRVERERRGL